jgi:hypothetical protein
VGAPKRLSLGSPVGSRLRARLGAGAAVTAEAVTADGPPAPRLREMVS